MTSYNNNDRSKDIKNTKMKPTIYEVIIIITVVTIIIMTKAITLMKTATTTVARIII